MIAVKLDKKNRIADILEAKGVSKYRLHINMNLLRPANAKPISYKTVLSIVNSDTVSFATHYGNMYLIAKVLNVSMDELQARE